MGEIEKIAKEMADELTLPFNAVTYNNYSLALVLLIAMEKALELAAHEANIVASIPSKAKILTLVDDKDAYMRGYENGAIDVHNRVRSLIPKQEDTNAK